MRSLPSCPTLGNLFAICIASWLLGACVHRASNDAEAAEPCEYVEDGECDEPEGTGLCREGTDRVDCSEATIARCRSTNDGVCDEPEGTDDCDEGTDVIDCRTPIATCPFTNDGTCDEPEGTSDCAEGTDVSDCSAAPAACASTNNGVCDEPDGTNTCPEGTDVADCAKVVCGAVACDPIDFGGLEFPSGISAGCCTPSGGCGLTTSEGVCTELFEPQPGYCPGYEFAPSFPLDGCCLPSGMCGLVFALASTNYCVEIDFAGDSPLAQFVPTTPVACDALDSDGGVD